MINEDVRAAKLGEGDSQLVGGFGKQEAWRAAM